VEILAFEVERQGFAQVEHDLVQGPSLRHDGDLPALGDVRLLAPRGRMQESCKAIRTSWLGDV
jgi:hypothetical protein